MYLLKVRVLDCSRLGGYIGQCAAASALPVMLLAHELFDCCLDLRPEIGAMESRLMNLVAAVLTVPAQAVNHVLRATLFNDNTHGVGKPDRVVRSVAGKKKHVALADDDVPEHAFVNNLEHHGSLVLVEPLRCLVDVVVGPRVWAADDLR